MSTRCRLFRRRLGDSAVGTVGRRLRWRAGAGIGRTQHHVGRHRARRPATRPPAPRRPEIRDGWMGSPSAPSWPAPAPAVPDLRPWPPRGGRSGRARRRRRRSQLEGTEPVTELRSRRTVRRFVGEGGHQQVHERPLDLRDALDRFGQPLRHFRHRRRLRVWPPGRVPGQQRIEGCRQRVDVAELGRCLAMEDLGRGVRRGDRLHPLAILQPVIGQRRQPEIGQPGSAVVVDQDVGRLDVAVQHPPGVGGGQGVRHAYADFPHPRLGRSLLRP